MHRHSFEWRDTTHTGTERIQTLACTTGCNTTRGTRAITDGGIFTSDGSTITGGQPDDAGLLIIPSSINGVPITAIDTLAFGTTSSADQNTSIITVIIKEGVEIIGTNAFRYCVNLTSVTIPSSVKTISGGTFRTCNSLSTVTIPEGVETIGNDAFLGTALTSITIPASVDSIGTQAFRSTPLTKVIFLRNDTIITLGDPPVFPPDDSNLRDVYLEGGAGVYERADTTSNTWTRTGNVP